MSQSIITTAFERWKAQESIDGNLIVLDEFVFAHIPNLELEKPIDRNEGLPDAKYIVHRQTVNKTGVVNQNAVAYSVTIGAEIGDFDFNWIGLLNKKSGTVAMIVHAPTQRKIKTQAGQQGNVLTRSFLLEYLGASKETAINTPAEMWQIDFTARLSGIDEMQRLINTDSYGEASFLGDAFLVGKTGNQYFVTKGIGYIGGLRAELTSNQNITVPAESTKVYADVSYQGNITSHWQTQIQLTVKPDLKNTIDSAGFAHFVFAIASISADGQITDLRPKGTLDFQQLGDALKAHEKSRNHPDATLKEKGFTTLNNQVGGSQTTSLTPFGAQEALKKYQLKGDYVTTSTMNVELNKKIDKSNISQQLANDVNKVPSLDLLAKELGKKQGIGNYQPAGNYALKTDLNNYQLKGDYVTNAKFNLEINKKIDKANIAQQLANDVNKVPSLDLLAKELGKKQGVGNYQPAGNYALKTDLNNYQLKGNYVTTATFNLEINKKIDKSSISQQLVNDVNKVPSLDLLAKELGKKQPLGSYVPNTRKVNGKQLSADITLNAGDVGAGAKNTGVKNNGGWLKCGDTGIIQQWNSHNWHSGLSLDFKFPIPFPNAVFVVMVTDKDGWQPMGTINRSKTGFTLTGNNNVLNFSYLAIGY
ncbi:phage tail protein [Proteus mirabilis]